MLGLSATLTEAVFVYLCICVFVFVYLHVRHLGTLFLRSLQQGLLKNIAHAWSIVKPILSGENSQEGEGGHMPGVNIAQVWNQRHALPLGSPCLRQAALVIKS